MEILTSAFHYVLLFIFGIVPSIYTYLVNLLPLQYHYIGTVVAVIVCVFIGWKLVKMALNKLILLFLLIVLFPFLSGVAGDFFIWLHLPAVGNWLISIKDFFVFLK